MVDSLSSPPSSIDGNPLALLCIDITGQRMARLLYSCIVAMLLLKNILQEVTFFS